MSFGGCMHPCLRKFCILRPKIAQFQTLFQSKCTRIHLDRWTKRMTEWQPRCGKRGRGRQKLRWRDDITSYAGTTWTRLAQDRKQWKIHEEGYIQQWMNTAW